MHSDGRRISLPKQTRVCHNRLALNRLASVFLTWLCLLAVVSAGGREAGFAVAGHTTRQHAAVITNDGCFSAVRVSSRTTSILIVAGDPGADPDAKAVISGWTHIPPVNETVTYDRAGNRRTDAQWQYDWDARNQLVRARTRDFDTAHAGWDVRFDYDSGGRRCKKTVTRKTTENGKTTVSREDVYFVWDDWNLIYERHESDLGLLLRDREYHWGEDVAGGSTGADGAGGAGGLLLIRDRRDLTRQTHVDHYPCHDAGGSVIALTDTAGNITARYEHGPFGEPLLATGPAAAGNPIRWASKYLDEETGLYYFGRRYFDPRTAQWLSREPLGEGESINLYSYCHNDPVNKVDVLGLAEAALDGDRKLTPFGSGLLVVARDDPERAIAMLLASQIHRETGALRIGADAAKAGAGVIWAAESALADTKREWRWLAVEAGIGADVHRHFATLPGFDSVVERAWSDTVPLLMAAAAADAEDMARSAARTAHQNSAAYKIPVLLRGAEYAIREVIQFNSFTRGVCGVEFAPGFAGMDDGVTAGGRAFAFGGMALAMAPMLRGGGFIDDFARAGVRRGRTFYTVQGEANAARLLSGGSPWPTAPVKAHLGEGLYTWGSRSQAEAYMSLLEGRGASGLRIMEASIPEVQYNTLRAMDLRRLGDDAANAWLGRHSSLFGEGAPHVLDHVIRDTGNFGPEFFFSKNVFPLFQLK